MKTRRSSSALLAVAPLEDRLAPAVTTYRWTGGGADALFSTAANWAVLDAGGNPTGPGVPTTDGNSALLFPARSALTTVRLNPTDDLGGGAAVTYAGVTIRDAYTVTDANGGTTTVTGGVRDEAAGATLDADLLLAGPMTVTVTPGASLAVAGDVGLGGQPLTVAGGGALATDSISGNGDVILDGGSKGANKAFNFTGNLTVNAGSEVAYDNSADGFISNGIAVTGGGTFVKRGTGGLTRQGAIGTAALRVEDGTLTLDAGATVAASTTVQVGDGAGAAGSAALVQTAAGQLPAAAVPDVRADGKLDLGATGATLAGLTGAGQVTVSGNADVVLDGSKASTFGGTLSGAGDLVRRGTGSTTLAGMVTLAPATGDAVRVEGGTFVVTGTVSGSTRVSGGTLTGTGTLGPVTVAAGGTLDPGVPNATTASDLGTIRVGPLTVASGGTVAVQEVGTGTLADRIISTGPLSLAGTLKVTVPANLGVTPGTAVTVISNAAAGTAAGTFAGLAEGGVVLDTTGRYGFTVSYQGGDGNDVSITESNPTVTVARSPGQPAGSGTGSASFDITYSRPVTGIDASDVIVQVGGGLTGPPMVTVTHQPPPADGTDVYRVTVAGLTGSGNLGVGVNTGAGTDAAGRPTNGVGVTDASSVVINTSSPVATFGLLSSNPTALSKVTVTVVFPLPVTFPGGVSASTFRVTNGTITGISARDIGSGVFANTQTLLDIVPTAPGLVTVTVPAGTFSDYYTGVPNKDQGISFTYDPTLDTTPPTVSTTSADTNPGPTSTKFLYTYIMFSEPVTGLTLSDFVPGPGTVLASDLFATNMQNAPSATYQLVLSPAAGTTQGTLSFTVAAGAATDLAGNPTPAFGFSRAYDSNAPASPSAAAARALLVGTPQPGYGGAGTAKMYNPDRSVRLSATPFPGFAGSLRTAAADFNADGVPDLAVGTGPGTLTQFKVLDGKDPTGNTVLFALAPFGEFGSGLYLSAGDVTGDGVPDLLITPDRDGGPRVKVIRGGVFDTFADFIGIGDPDFRDGAVAAVGDITGDGRGDLIVSAGVNGGPRIALYDGRGVTGNNTPPKLVGDFFAFDPDSRAGAYVAAGDVDGDGLADLVFGSGPGAAPRVRVLSGANLAGAVQGTPTVIADFAPGGGNGGAPVAVKDLDGDRFADLLVGATAPAAGRVTAFAGAGLRGSGPPVLFADDANAAFTGGVFVG